MSDILDAFKNTTEEEAASGGKTLRIGIIGCGGIAKSHVRAYLNAPGAEIVAGCDLIPGKADAFFKSFGIEGAKTHYKNHEEMLADKSLNLDAVSVCTYNRQHVCCSIAALNAGVSVLLEKPLCVTMDEAWELYDAKCKSSAVLSIGFQPRFDANMKDVKAVVESGVLGNIYYVQTGGGRRHGVPFRDDDIENTFVKDETAGIGAIGDIGCYSLDMVMNALGHPKPLTVTGYKSDLIAKQPEYYYFNKKNQKNSENEMQRLADSFTVDDFGAAFIRLEGGIIIDFRIAWAMHLDTPGDTIIYGTKGSLRIPSTNCWNGSIGGPLKVYSEIAGKQVETELPMAPAPKPGEPTLWDKKIRSFLSACRGECDVPVPIEEILYNQAMLSGIITSSELGREIELDFSKMGK